MPTTLDTHDSQLDRVSALDHLISQPLQHPRIKSHRPAVHRHGSELSLACDCRKSPSYCSPMASFPLHVGPAQDGLVGRPCTEHTQPHEAAHRMPHLAATSYLQRPRREQGIKGAPLQLRNAVPAKQVCRVWCSLNPTFLVVHSRNFAATNAKPMSEREVFH